MKKNQLLLNYESPAVTMVEIAVEAGVADSKNGQFDNPSFPDEPFEY